MVFCLIKEEDKVTVLSIKKEEKRRRTKKKKKDQWVTEPYKKRREPKSTG